MSKSWDRRNETYWERRLFRNTYTYRGERREVAGWCVKIQWKSERRTVRLQARDRRTAAAEATRLYLELRRGGWPALARAGTHGSASTPRDTAGAAPSPETPSVSLRKYVSHLNPGFSRELFAELADGGAVEQIALGTEDPNEARLRAAEAGAEFRENGWEHLRLTRSREVTIAVFWLANPMTCTYTTLLTHPAVVPSTPRSSDHARRRRILVVEPDGSVRRALLHWLARGPVPVEVDGISHPTDVVERQDGWIVLANQNQPPAAVRALAQPAGRRRTPGRALFYGLYRDSDAIFASVSGVTRGYFLRRVAPAALLEPLLGIPVDSPMAAGDVDRQIVRFFQKCLEPDDGRRGVHASALTARESDVLELVRRGCVDKEVARELGISVWTVHSHWKRIFAKYGVRTRTEAVVRHLQK